MHRTPRNASPLKTTLWNRPSSPTILATTQPPLCREPQIWTAAAERSADAALGGAERRRQALLCLTILRKRAIWSASGRTRNVRYKPDYFPPEFAVIVLEST